MCRSCGFVSNIPRPDEQDIDAKYRFLVELGPDHGAPHLLHVQRRRARELYSFLTPWIPPAGTVLDFGGDDGCLMSAFADMGHECLLVDYNDSPQSHVTKIGDTHHDLPGDLMVDVIICAHVLEHVAAPVSVIATLADHLGPSGILFIEVPMEIWRRPPLRIEPVTHVNFFVPTTLQRCVAEAGLHVIDCRLVPSLHPNGTRPAAVRLVADNCRSPRRALEGASEVRRFLSPGWIDRLRYYQAIRPNLAASLYRKAARTLSGVPRTIQ